METRIWHTMIYMCMIEKEKMSPMRRKIERRWSPLCKKLMDWYSVGRVYTEGDITVSLSGHETPLRTDGPSLQLSCGQPRFITDSYTHIHTHAIRGPAVSRGLTFVPFCVCAAMWVQRLPWSSGLHRWRHTYDEDPEVPLARGSTIQLLFPLCPGDLTILSVSCILVSTTSCRRRCILQKN